MAKPQALRREPGKEQSEKQRLRGVHGGAPRSMHEIDRLIHERLRLGIISALAVNESTVRRYLDLMTGVFMVRQLPPWSSCLVCRSVLSCGALPTRPA